MKYILHTTLGYPNIANVSKYFCFQIYSIYLLLTIKIENERTIDREVHWSF